MIYLMKLKNGTDVEISQDARDQISALLIGPKENRPEFIEVKSAGVVVSVSSVAAIVQHKKEPERLPSQDEELAAFNERWERGHGNGNAVEVRG